MHTNIMVVESDVLYYILGYSQGYNISQFSDMNTQVVEQSNSLLKCIKSSVSYMNTSNFMKHLKFYLWYHNSNNQFCITYNNNCPTSTTVGPTPSN